MPRLPVDACRVRRRALGRKDAMKTYTGTMTPTRRDLNDARSSGRIAPSTPKTPVLNDRRSTR
jgi:hypothetical protein